MATQHDVIAGQRADHVRATVGVLDRLHPTQCDRLVVVVSLAGERVDRRSQDLTRVADDQVVAVAGANQIVEAAADDDVIAVARLDRVGAASVDDHRVEAGVHAPCRRRRGADDLVDVVSVGRVGRVQLQVVVVVDVPAVAQDDVAVRRRHGSALQLRVTDQADTDLVAAVATEYDVIARQRLDRVRATVRILDRLHSTQRDRVPVEVRLRLRVQRRRQDVTGVAEHEVVTVAGPDHVAEATADDDVVAVARVDRVRTAGGRRRGARDLVDVAEVAILGHEVDEAVVAEDDVVAAHIIDQVSVVAAQNPVVAQITRDRVRRAVRELVRLDANDLTRRQYPQRAWSLTDDAVVAEDDVVTRIAVDLVAASDQPVTRQRRAGIRCRHGQLARGQIHVEAGVAVDVVVAGLAEDHVVARTAGQVVARLAADDQINPGAAVDRQAERRSRCVDDVVTGVVEDDGVALDGFRTRNRVVAAAVL